MPIGHTSEVNAVSFSPDGQSIVTGSDTTAILWNYVDVNEYPGAYSLRGLYRIEEENIQIKLILFNETESFDIPIDPKDTVEDLMDEIIWALQDKMDELERR